MADNLYAIIGFVCMLVNLVIMRCGKQINNGQAEGKRRLIAASLMCIIFGFVDGVWGLFNSGVLKLGVEGFWLASFAFHFMACLVTFGWFLFISAYFGYNDSVAIKSILSVPFLATIVVLIIQISTDCIFSIDENLTYNTGKARPILFYVQFFYFIIAFARGILFLIKNKENEITKYSAIIAEFLVIPVLSGIMQLLFPDAPYYSVGIILTSILLFNGMIVIERSIENEKYELISKEVYKALEVLSHGFVSVHLFDLRYDTGISVKSSPQVDAYVDPDVPFSKQIRTVMEGVCTPEYVDDVVAFVDTSTLSERMMNQDSISMLLLGKISGWCISSFLAVERDENGKLIKAIHSVQNVNEERKKEEEYMSALKRAYENKNVIYGELLKMQSVGVIAEDESERLMLANDKAKEMFGHTDDEKVEGMSIVDFLGDSAAENPNETREKYISARSNGGQFSFEMIVNDRKDKRKHYLSADMKSVDLMDGTRVLITCFSDITKRKMVEKRLKDLSEMDSLTKIANRRCGEEEVKMKLKEGVPGLYCLLDINNFKQINDTYGHMVGDSTLEAVANALKASFRNEDVIMRLGGDEFAVFAEKVSSSELARTRISGFFDNISLINIEEMGEGAVTVSLGAVMIDENSNMDYDELYSKADTAMYTCKGKKGNNMALMINM